MPVFYPLSYGRNHVGLSGHLGATDDTPLRPDLPQNKVTISQHLNLGGDRRYITPGSRVNLKSNWENAVSSMYIPPKMEVTVYSKFDRQGRSRTWTAGDRGTYLSNLRDFDRWNDAISCIEVVDLAAEELAQLQAEAQAAEERAEALAKLAKAKTAGLPYEEQIQNTDLQLELNEINNEIQKEAETQRMVQDQMGRIQQQRGGFSLSSIPTWAWGAGGLTFVLMMLLIARR